MNLAVRPRLILPIGLLISICCWSVLLSLKDQLPYSNPNISLFWQACLVGLFVFEGIVSLAWSWIILGEAKAAGKIATSGPYAIVRHPIFATILWDGTGCLAFYFKAWIILLALVPLSLLWSWLASIEERYLERQYGNDYWHHFEHIGQLFPSFKVLDNISRDSVDN